MSASGNSELTPKKNKQDEELRFINSPMEKAQDLYERLINASPPKKLHFNEQVFSQQIQQEQPYSSDMVQQYSESEEVSASRTPQISVKNELKQTSQQYTIRKLTTPNKVSKGCHCQKSHCLKKYCDCFKIGQVCGTDCLCIGCQNSEITEQHHKLVKQIQLTKSGKGGKQPKCNCQKSHCLKNYCQCHSAGRSCSANCNCIQCENKLQLSSRGRKRRHLQVSCWEAPSQKKQNILFN